jgi:DNA-binding transcriptional LysR family regulator
MTLEQLRYFYEVAQCLNFSQAARNLFISQPNLTKYIANLERELGFKLFDRSTHHCELTESGQQFMRSTEPLFHQLNSYIESAKLRAQNPFPVVNIGMAQSEIPPLDMMNLLDEKNLNSGTRYILQEDNYLGLIRRLRAQELDLIVTTDRNAREMADFDYLTLRRFDMLLAVHNDNPKARMKDLTPKDCADEMFFICVPDGRYIPINRMEEIYWKTGVRMNFSITYSPADVLLNTQTRAGVGIVPSTMPLSRYRDLSFYRFEPWNGTTQSLLWRKNETRPEVLSFVEHISKLAPFYQPADVPVFGLPEEE